MVIEEEDQKRTMRSREIDVIKGIGIVLVVIGHSGF